MSRPININVSNTLVTTQAAQTHSKMGTLYSYYPSHTAPHADNHFAAHPEDYKSSSFGKPTPIKHWRRQLIRLTTPETGAQGSTRGKLTLNIVDAPGALPMSISGSCACDLGADAKVNNAYAVIDDAVRRAPGEGSDTAKIYNDGFVDCGDHRIYTGVYNTRTVGPCPQKRPVRTGSTLLSKAYFSDTRAFMQSRGRTYLQNTTSEITNCVHPEFLETAGPQCVVTAVYKPNNANFSTQGAVSSGLRLERLKRNTITKNGNSFFSAYGMAAANAGKYHGSNFTPYFIKNKMQAPVCSTAGMRIREHARVCVTA